MEAARDEYGNPSGVHGVSRSAKNMLEELRERAAELIGAAHPLEIVFTSGGTESDNLAVTGAAPGHVITSAIEHQAVLRAVDARRSASAIVGVGPAGVVDPGDVVSAIRPDTTLVSVMMANNETGVVQPLSEIIDGIRSIGRGVLVHTDAVQAFASTPIDVTQLDVDMVSLAAHKFGGPKGVGLLYVRNGVKLRPGIVGGSQELGRRAGTHNTMGVAGMVAAMDAADADRADFRTRVGEMRDEFEAVLQAAIPDLAISGFDVNRLPQHSHVSFPGTSSEDLLIKLDAAGVAAAAGSACQSGAVERSHVLAAMGFDDARAAGSVRFSLGWSTEPEDVKAAAKVVTEVVSSGTVQ